MLPTYLIDTIVLLVAAVILVPLMQYLRLGSIIGFLAAGTIVGPWAFGFISEVEEIRHFAELGVAFLLFIIGVELKPRRLLLMRKWVFGLGSAQVLVTGVALMGIAMMLGLSLRQGLIVGFGLALSSTAFVLQLLTEKGLIGTEPGKRSFAILLMQDLAVVPLLALVPLMAQGDFGLEVDLVVAFAEAVLIVVLIIIAGRFLLSPLLHLVARSGNTDIFAAAALLLVLGVAGLITLAGFSLAMGAFVAGLLIADSEYRHQVLADIQPFRGFLLGLFFMTVGMSMDVGLLIKDWPYLLLLLAALIAVKAAITWILAKMFAMPTRPAFAVSLVLAQGGEFAFVIFGIALTLGLFDKTLFDHLILIVTLGMIATPGLAMIAQRFFTSDPGPQETKHMEESESGYPTIIVGFGRVGRRAAQMMEFAKTRYIAIDSNPDLVSEYRKLGYPVFFGNADNFDVLVSIGLKHCRLVVITIDQQQTTKRLVKELRRLSPQLHILARGRDRAHCTQLLKAGADETVSEAFEASVQLGAKALQHLDQPADLIRQAEDHMRESRKESPATS